MINTNFAIALAYNSGQAPAELITNDLLKNIFKPMLGLPDYASLARVSKAFQKKIQPILDGEWNRVFKEITFGRDKWLNIPGVVSVCEAPPFTEEQIKSLTAKFKGICPVFNEPDPEVPHRFENDKVKKVWQTHMLIFFPESINNNPRTLNVIGHLFRFAREREHPTVFSCYPGTVESLYFNRSSSGSYWRVVSRDVFPGSRQVAHDKMMEIVKNKECFIPSPNDAVTAMLIMILLIHL